MKKATVTRALRRTLYYVTAGYAMVSMPFVFFGYVSSIYYLVPFAKTLFPTFESFVSIAGTALIVGCYIVGWLYTKRTFLFREAQEVLTEANPYLSRKLVPVSLPAYKLFLELAKEKGYNSIADEIETIVRNTEGRG